MAPIRRYLRITRYSVLEVRIYLDNPALANSWLLNSRDPVLPRVIEAVRPLVLPKLREENENAKKKGKKKKGVRDVVVQDDFEVSIFLTETSTTHAMLTKQKSFAEKPRLKSNTSRLTSFFNSADKPIHVREEEEEEEAPAILLEEDAEETRLADIPEATETVNSRNKRRRRDEDDTIFVQSDEEEEEKEEVAAPRRKRNKVKDDDDDGETDDKKKLALSTAYEGFSIYGRILCLIVKRKGVKKPVSAGQAASSQMLENWVSTQADNDGMLDDADEG